MPGNPNPNMSGLRPWKKGQSGNPKGRPKGQTITERLRQIVMIDNDGAAAEALAKMCVSYAAKGDFRFFKELIDRIDGKTPDKLEAVTDNTVRVVFESEPPKPVEGDN